MNSLFKLETNEKNIAEDMWREKDIGQELLNKGDGRIFGNANLVMTILIMTNLVRKNLVMTNMVKICYKSGNDKVGTANLVK